MPSSISLPPESIGIRPSQTEIKEGVFQVTTTTETSKRSQAQYEVFNLVNHSDCRDEINHTNTDAILTNQHIADAFN